jgi:predicted dehydrogenase
MKLRVGVIGLGDAWDSRHRPALRAMTDRFEVRAFCDPVAHLAENAARDFNAAAVDGFRALAARDDIDAVLMLSSDWFGPLPILAACENGKAVYCAAALDIDPERAKDVKLRVETSGVAFMAEFPRRTMPATLRLKELIATRLGKPRILFCHARQRLMSGKRNGQLHAGYRYPTGVRELMELVDWCRYVIGDEPTSVVGLQHRDCHGQECDYQMLSLDFSPGETPGAAALAHISFGSYLSPRWPEAVAFRPPAALQVCCENGVAFVDLPATLVWFDEAGQHLESLESERPVGERLLTQFYRAVTSLVRKTSDLEDAYRALRIVQQARISFRENRRAVLDF